MYLEFSWWYVGLLIGGLILGLMSYMAGMARESKLRDSSIKEVRNRAFNSALIILNGYLLSDDINLSDAGSSVQYLLETILLPLGYSGRSVEDLLKSSECRIEWNTNFPAVQSLEKALRDRLTSLRQAYIDKLVATLEDRSGPDDEDNILPITQSFRILWLWAGENDIPEQNALKLRGERLTQQKEMNFEKEVHGQIARLMIRTLAVQHNGDYDNLKLEDLKRLKYHIDSGGGATSTRIDKEEYNRMFRAVTREYEILIPSTV